MLYSGAIATRTAEFSELELITSIWTHYRSYELTPVTFANRLHQVLSWLQRTVAVLQAISMTEQDKKRPVDNLIHLLHFKIHDYSLASLQYQIETLAQIHIDISELTLTTWVRPPVSCGHPSVQAATVQEYQDIRPLWKPSIRMTTSKLRWSTDRIIYGDSCVYMPLSSKPWLCTKGLFIW